MLALTINGNTEVIDDNETDAALFRYWKARQGGDQTAKLKRIDPSQAPVVAPGKVSELAAHRVKKQEELARAAGFELPPPLFMPGTRVLPLGDDNFRTERRRVKEMPHFEHAAARVIETIASESREDLEVPLTALTMREDGKLTWEGTSLGLGRDAFRQLGVLGGFGSGIRYLTDHCHPELRAHNVNDQLTRAEDRSIVLRTRQGRSGHRQVYAVVTKTYATVDADRVLQAVAPHLDGAHAEIAYDGSSVRATALWMPDEVVDLAAGDVFKAGVRVETDDTGQGRLRVSGVLWRNLCLNLIIVGEGHVETLSRVHRGDPSRILDDLGKGIEGARAAVGDFLEAWGHARQTRTDVPKLLEDWVRTRKLQVPGVRSAAERDAVVESLLQSWTKEPGDTVADAVNAVTRAAHENPMWGIDIREELERQASRLVLLPA